MANKRIQRERKLIIILAALSVLFFALTFGIRAAENRKTDENQVYIDEATMADLPKFVEVTDSAGHFVLEDEKGYWYLEGNRDLPIDGLKVTETRSVSKYFAPGRILTGQKDNMAGFGLEDPQATVTLKTDTGEITYLIGDFNPVTNEYYVSLKDSDTVYLIPRKDGESLKKTLLEYVDEPAIAKASFSDISVIMVKSSDGAYIITADSGRYILQNTEGTFEIDQAKAMEIFNCFTSSVYYRCVEYDCTAEGLRDYGLDDPSVLVRFRLADDGTETGLRVSEGPDGAYYITDDDGKIVYTISEDDYNDLRKKIKINR